METWGRGKAWREWTGLVASVEVWRRCGQAIEKMEIIFLIIYKKRERYWANESSSKGQYIEGFTCTVVELLMSMCLQV